MPYIWGWREYETSLHMWGKLCDQILECLIFGDGWRMSIVCQRYYAGSLGKTLYMYVYYILWVSELYHIIFFKNKLMTCGRIMNPRTDKTLQSPRFWRSCIQVHVFFRDVLVSFFIVIYYKIKKCKLDDSPSSPKTANQSGKQQRKPQEFWLDSLEAEMGADKTEAPRFVGSTYSNRRRSCTSGVALGQRRDSWEGDGKATACRQGRCAGGAQPSLHSSPLGGRQWPWHGV